MIQAIVEKANQRVQREANQEGLLFFIEQYLRNVPQRYIQAIGERVLLDQALDCWALLQTYKGDQPKISLEHRSLPKRKHPRLFVNILGPNRPYLVDTLSHFFKEAYFQEEGVIHPVLNVQRSPEGNLEALRPLPHEETNQEEFLVSFQVKEPPSGGMNGLEAKLQTVLKQLEWFDKDRGAIRQKLSEIEEKFLEVEQEARHATGFFFPAGEFHQVRQFLQWLQKGFFVFLGARFFQAEGNQKGVLCLQEKKESAQGLFKSDDLFASDDLVPGISRAKVSPNGKSQELPLLAMRKTNLRSPILRPSRIDSFEVIDVETDGKVKGLFQFMGLFTQDLFTQSVFSIPLLDQKAQKVFKSFHFNADWYHGKKLIKILESIPKDELFHIPEEDTKAICEKVFQLEDYGSLAVFPRDDLYGRYVNVLMYLSRERYSYTLRDKIAEFLGKFFEGKIASCNVLIGPELPFARLTYVVTFSHPKTLTYNSSHLESGISRVALSWVEQLGNKLKETGEEDEAYRLFSLYKQAFPTAYREQFSSLEACDDIASMEGMKDKIALQFYEGTDTLIHIKIFHVGEPLSLSTSLPILQNFGFKIVTETPYVIDRKGKKIWLHDFVTTSPVPEHWYSKAEELRQLFFGIWKGHLENDGLNQLILRAALTGREVELVRAYGKYLKQIQLPYSQSLLEQTLADYPCLTQLMVIYFKARFDPVLKDSRDQKVAEIKSKIQESFQHVTRLDQELIFQRFFNVIDATVRTNFFQKEGDQFKERIVFKIASSQVTDLPTPRPLYETFIYHAHLEAIHLRGGRVARGGIRASDRLEDLRTEILGLMKAQMVKNTVIVPVGSKGGFLAKNSSNVIQAYKMMMRGLLDITDNLVEGKVVPPDGVVRYDEDDPYLVVAADKGTASFSDYANKIATEYGFWLDDAFASGGSHGYDHKKIGITARGAWESVKHHFRQLEIDVQKQPITVVGIGDMGGDVFGNGMLQSTAIQLVGAFNHAHIFLDPNPDPKSSFQERQRLFQAAQSGWNEYRGFSEGGGVFSRSEKRIILTPQVKERLAIQEESLPPDDLIQHLLKAPVDLLWFGGIGTFIRASSQLHVEVGDRSNDFIRIKASELKARVIAEGANLGMTQKARVEYALKGGLLNTDALDNSAGVDCSDHEVNIKILFRKLEHQGRLVRDKRNKILAEMTSEVAELVLRDNYLQNQILTVMQSTCLEDLEAYQELVHSWEGEGLLDREGEGLPTDETLSLRRTQKKALTRPELCVLLAYSKIALYKQLCHSTISKDTHCFPILQKYFPRYLQENYPQEMEQHPLRSEIISTVLTNLLINRMGPLFLPRHCRVTGESWSQTTHHFLYAVHLLGIEELWGEIESLDHLKRNEVQVALLTQLRKALSQILMWLSGRTLACLEPPSAELVRTLLREVPAVLFKEKGSSFHRVVLDLQNQGVPDLLSQRFAAISSLPFVVTMVDLYSVEGGSMDLSQLVQAYFFIHQRWALGNLIELAEKTDVMFDWQRAFVAQLIYDILQVQVAFTRQLLISGQGFEEWAQKQEGQLKPYQAALAEAQKSGQIDLSLLGYLVRRLKRSTELS